MQTHRISAGALVEHQGRLLLVHHLRPGRYDFWVAPGGGVKGDETLEAAAAREVQEETGLQVAVGKLLYVEDLISPECRFVKFWFAAALIGGTLDFSHPEARLEHVVDGGWFTPDQLLGMTLFPEVLAGRYAADQAAGFPGVVRLPLREMAFW
jgi:8-oxo-dGTP pyrophosphatase MutT (NUDIX family)